MIPPQLIAAGIGAVGQMGAAALGGPQSNDQKTGVTWGSRTTIFGDGNSVSAGTTGALPAGQDGNPVVRGGLGGLSNNEMMMIAGAGVLLVLVIAMKRRRK